MVAPLDALLDLVGPFLFPVVLFGAGLVGYGVLVALGRAGVLGSEPDAGRGSGDSHDESPDGEGDRRGGSRRR